MTVTRPDCVFCRIVAGDMPADVVGETDRTLAFRDIRPAAPVHVLLIPKDHVADDAEHLGSEHAETLGELFDLARTVAVAEGVSGAWRLVSNVGPAAGQSVFHVHFHLMGGWQRGPRRLAEEVGG